MPNSAPARALGFTIARHRSCGHRLQSGSLFALCLAVLPLFVQPGTGQKLEGRLGHLATAGKRKKIKRKYFLGWLFWNCVCAEVFISGVLCWQSSTKLTTDRVPNLLLMYRWIFRNCVRNCVRYSDTISESQDLCIGLEILDIRCFECFVGFV
jgi:hypothetical protein